MQSATLGALLFSSVLIVGHAFASSANSHIVARRRARAAQEHQVGKVIKLLQDLSATVKSESKTEAVAFDKFDHWCSTSSKTVEKAIAREQAQISTLESQVESEQEALARLGEEVAALKDEIVKLNDAHASADARRADGSKLYLQVNADHNATISAMEEAIAGLEDSRKGGAAALTQVLSEPKLRLALALADVSSGSSLHNAQRLTLAQILQEPARPALEAEGDHAAHVRPYNFKSGDITELLKELKRKFADDRLSATKAETNAQNSHGLEQQARLAAIEAAETSEKEKTTAIGDTSGDLAQHKGELQDASDDLATDSKTLDETQKSCRQKKQEWDERSSVRAQELEAIGQAIEILAKVGGVRTEAPSNPVSSPSPLEQPGPEELAVEAGQVPSGSVEPPVVAASAEAAAVKAEEAPAPSAALPPPPPPASGNGDLGADDFAFLQLSNPQQRAVNLLRTRARAAHSKALARMAQEISAHMDDPFAEVSNMIEKMVFRLMSEQTDEDNHKNWCDQELSKTNASSTNKQDKIDDLTVKINSAQATLQKLVTDIEEANTMAGQITSFTAEATEIRAIGKQENAKALKDAQDAQTAIANAVAVLQTFYKDTGMVQKAAWEFVQRGVDLPDDPSTWTASYTGVADPKAQPGGIVAVLEKAASEFATMEADTRAQEASDQKAFDDEMSALAINKAERMKESEMKAVEKRRVSEKFDSMTKSRKHVSGELESVKQYLSDLAPACLEGDSTYEERKAARATEVDALKEAKRIFGDAATRPDAPPANASFVTVHRRLQ